MSHGAIDHLGRWIDPVKYLAIRICLAAIGFTIGVYINAFLGLIKYGHRVLFTATVAAVYE